MAIIIRRDNDPFKKYWWVLLLGFGLVGGWICLPLMDSSVGSGSVSTKGEQGLKSANQSLDAVNNPGGAPGSAVDLSMTGSGAYRKKDSGPITSSLYQAPPEAAAPAGALAFKPSGAGLADALKDISKKTAAVDPSGWGGAKAQKGFTPPRSSFGSMSGFGGGSGSAAAQAGGSAASFGSSAFGAATAKTGMTSTRGLSGGDDVNRGPAMKALSKASANALAAAGQRSADAARQMSGQTFDGGKGGSGIGAMGSGSAEGGLYGSLDAAPMNLKVNDPKLNDSKIEPPEHQEHQDVDTERQKQEMIKMMIMMAVIGGITGGGASAIMGPMMMGMMMQQQQNTQAIDHQTQVGKKG